MKEQKNLNELKTGESVNHYLLVNKIEIRTTKTNKEYLSFEFSDSSRSISANMWDNIGNVVDLIEQGKVAFVTGTMSEYQGTPQIKLSNVRPVNENDNITPRDFLPKSHRDLSLMQKEFKDRIDKITNPFLKELITSIFNEGNFDKFSEAPAGKSWHHAYIRGLIEHTLEIIKICDLMCDFHSELNRDLLICSAMLHDFGKTIELEYDSSFEYTNKGKLIGHIVIVAMLIDDEVKKINGFPEELKNHLIHLVLSHQGKLEFASPVIPKTVEAIALYQADELSAKVNAYKNAIKQGIKEGSNWTRFISLANTDLTKTNIPDSTKENTKTSLFD